jgi:pSer/pThr/pTyr-binding forkhead associated (FHA) protein
MDIFERFNSKFGKWYEGLFGSEGGGELRPKDVLRKLTAAMEDNRKEGLDGKVYVPNKYVLELAVGDTDERDYLLSFLDEEELVAVLQKFMAQHGYQTRGPLDFTIAEIPEAERETRREKLRVKVRYEKGEKEAPTPGGSHRPLPPQAGEGLGEEKKLKSNFSPLSHGVGEGSALAPGVGASDNLPTVASVNYEDDDEPGTVPAVAWAALAVTSPEGRKSHFSLTKPTVQIGRSRNAGNDLILDSDGMASKAHARLERERDGQWTLYDLSSTNGVKVGAMRVDGNRVLSDGDEITIGGTLLMFHLADTRPASAPAPVSSPSSAPPRRARLIGPDGEAFVLASETLIGRAVTSDIVLSDPSVATKHARIIAPDAATYFLEDLSGHSETRVNDRVLFPGQRLPLTNGDVLSFGTVQMRFAAGTAA